MSANRVATAFFGIVLIALVAQSSQLAAQEDAYAGVHTLGVISALGNTAFYQKQGITVFDTYDKSFALDWNVDAKVSQALSTTLAARFGIKPAPPLPSKTNDAFLRIGIFDSGPDFKKLSAYLKQLPSAGDVDAFMVVLPARIKEDLYMAPRTLTGIGLYRETSRSVALTNIEMYAAFGIVVVEARTGNVISWGYADAFGNARHRQGYVRSSCLGSWPTTVDDISSDQKQTINAQTEKLVFRGVAAALRGIGLPVDLVPNELPSQPAIIQCSEPS